MRPFCILCAVVHCAGILLISLCIGTARSQQQNVVPSIEKITPTVVFTSERPQVITLYGSGFTEDTHVTFRYQAPGAAMRVIARQPIWELAPNTLSIVGVFESHEGTWTVELTNENGTSGQRVLQVVNGVGREPSPESSGTGCVTPPAYILDDYPSDLKKLPVDSTDWWSFLTEECTSFAAWRLNRDQLYPISPSKGSPGPFLDQMTRKVNGVNVTDTWGCAFHWAGTQPTKPYTNDDCNKTVRTQSAAQNLGYVADSKPRIGSIAQWGFTDGLGQDGHVAYVEQVNPDGTVYVSDYNHDLKHAYCYHIPATNPGRFIHINDPGGSAFSISANPASRTINRGDTAQFTVTVKATGSYSSSAPIVFHTINLPPGFGSGTGWNTAQLNLKANQSGSSVLTVVTNGLTVSGVTPITVRASDGQNSQDVTLNLTINVPDKTAPAISSWSVSPTSLTLNGAVAVSYTASDSGGSGLLRAELWRAPDSNGQPGNWTDLKSQSLSGNGPTPVSFSDTPTSTGKYWYGTHLFDGAGNQTNEPKPVQVTVNPAASPGFTLTSSTSSQTVTEGQSASFTLTVHSQNGFSATVTPAALNLPTGYVASGTYWSPVTVTPSPNGSASLTLTVGTNLATKPGTYSVTLQGSATGYSAQSISVTITVKQAAAFYIGENVKVSGTGTSGLKLHNCADTTCKSLVTMPEGTVMQVIGGTGTTGAEGYIWWQLSGTVGKTSYQGWAVQNYLAAD
jgi:surface antigen